LHAKCRAKRKLVEEEKKDTTREKSFNVNHSSPRHCWSGVYKRLQAAHSTTKSSILFELNTMYSIEFKDFHLFSLFSFLKTKTKKKKGSAPEENIFSFVGHRANKERRI
jgi:hypothetical protein